jgi:DNA-binding GntR family transcriptional regulator
MSLQFPIPQMLNKRSTPDMIASALRDAIFQGYLPSGSPLKQVEIAKHFGVSPAPVREAFQKLVAEGLAETRHNRGVAVAPLSESDIVDIAELRILLEAHAFRRSAPHLTEGDFVKAEDIVRRAETAVDRDTQASLHWDFHRTIYQKAQRPRLVAQIDLLFVNMNRYLMPTLMMRDHWQESHLRLVSAFRCSDVEAAVALNTEQIQQAVDRVLMYLHDREHRRS